MLAVGTSITDAAEAMAGSRQTVSDWLHRHHGFQAALNRRRRELWTNVSDRLRALLPAKALTVLEREVEKGDAPLTGSGACPQGPRCASCSWRGAGRLPAVTDEALSLGLTPDQHAG